jgi:hypothetical protein
MVCIAGVLVAWTSGFVAQLYFPLTDPMVLAIGAGGFIATLFVSMLIGLIKL